METAKEKSETEHEKEVSPEGIYDGYSEEYTPLSSYLLLMGFYVGALTTTALIMKRRKRRPPEEIRAKDVVLVGVATQKLARILTRERVTSGLRAPFTRFEQSAGAGELEETPRGRGLRRAIGQLAVCPWCATPWVATWFVCGLSLWPRQTRYVASIFSSVAVADFVNQAYVKTKELNE